jgi:hypothetical protein
MRDMCNRVLIVFVSTAWSKTRIVDLKISVHASGRDLQGGRSTNSNRYRLKPGHLAESQVNKLSRSNAPQQRAATCKFFLSPGIPSDDHLLGLDGFRPRCPISLGASPWREFYQRELFQNTRLCNHGTPVPASNDDNHEKWLHSHG